MYWIALICAALAAVCAGVYAMWQAEEMRGISRDLAAAEGEIGRLKRLYRRLRVLAFAGKEEGRRFKSLDLTDLLMSVKGSTVQGFVSNLEKQVHEDLTSIFLVYADRFQTGECFREFGKEPRNEKLFEQCVTTAEQLLKK